MVYANVIVASRTKVQELTYSVPASIIPYIQPGKLVAVPLRRKVMKGVVVSLTRSVPIKLRAAIRNIESVDRKLGFSQSEIAVIHDLATYYAASLGEVSFHALRFPHANNSTEIFKKNAAPRPTFIQASWPDRRKFYVDVVSRYPDKKVVILLPGEEFINDLLRDNIVAVSKNVTVGSLSQIFSPLEASDFLIIDQPNHYAFRTIQRPIMTACKIAKLRQLRQGFHLIFGDTIIFPEDYYEASKNNWRIVTKKPQGAAVTIVSEKPQNFLSPSIIEEVNKSKSLVFVTASKNWAPAIICEKCKNIRRCSACDRTISQLNEESLICNYCRHQENVNPCPYCGSNLSRSIGVGAGSLAKKIDTAFSRPVTTRYPTGKKEILVTTEVIEQHPRARFDDVVVLKFDHLLTGVMPNGIYRLLRLLLDLKSKSKKLFIQTQFPDHWAWGALMTGKVGEYITAELADRKQYFLPPFGTVIKVAYFESSLPSDVVVNEIVRRLSTLLPDADISPAEPIRLLNRSGIQLTIYVPGQLNSKQKEQLAALLPLSWQLIWP